MNQKFQIQLKKISYDGRYNYELVSSNVELNEQQIDTLRRIPDYWSDLELKGEIEGHHLLIQSASTPERELRYMDIDEMISGFWYDHSEFLTNDK